MTGEILTDTLIPADACRPMLVALHETGWGPCSCHCPHPHLPGLAVSPARRPVAALHDVLDHLGLACKLLTQADLSSTAHAAGHIA